MYFGTIPHLLSRFALAFALLEELVESKEALGLAVRRIDVRRQRAFEASAASEFDGVLPFFEGDRLLAWGDLNPNG